jgi:hypothetical protein
VFHIDFIKPTREKLGAYLTRFNLRMIIRQNKHSSLEAGKIGGKFAQSFDKVAKTVAKPKNAKTSSSKLNLKLNIYINPF